tara:strand:+ start:1791 stop:3131 length:1341 start_codon:yes stop_codon:yes gene_type:complete
MISKIANIFKVKDLRKKVFFTLALLIVYRLGGQVMIPGFASWESVSQFTQFSSEVKGGILSLYDQFVGGFLSQASIFTLGIMPYISASIVIQLMTAVVPYFQRLKKEGADGNKKIIQLTRYGTVLIALFQSVGLAAYFWSFKENSGDAFIVLDSMALFYFVTMLTLVTGTIFVMWLGEQITDYGIGNGISLIITVGILAAAPATFGGLFKSMYDDPEGRMLFGLMLIFLLIVITMFVVLITSAQRKIPVQFAKRVVGRKVYGGQASFIPLKILTAGVMPIIFAQALMFLPGLIAQLSGWTFLQNIFAATHPVYTICFALLIIVFTYFYTAIAFNPVDVADNMKKQGGFIPGVRPGKPTAEFLDNILTRVTLPASIALAFIAIIPTLVNQLGGVEIMLSYFFGGTSIIIAVGVALDTMQQIEGQLVSRHYDSFLKTGKIKGRSRNRY